MQKSSRLRLKVNEILRLSVILIFYTPILAGETHSDSGKVDFYEKGKRLRDAGDWQAALQTWRDGRAQLEREGKADARLGIAFVELVAEQGAEAHSGEASDFYFWSLMNADIVAGKKVISQERKRIEPLLDKEHRARWHNWVDEAPRTLVHEMLQFWAERDPIPSTVANERLLEHWRRIVHARENYQTSVGSVYRTDDRGVIYVRYGQPDREKRITLGTNTTELMTWAELADFGEVNLLIRGPGESFIELKRGMTQYLTYPECEIWMYESLGSEEPVVFLFGPEDGLGAFQLLNGVEDLIPSTAFTRQSTRATGGLVPGSLLQLMYYGKLSVFDPSFEDRYAELEGIWTQAYMYAERAASFGQHAQVKGYVETHLRRELLSRRREFDTYDTFNPRHKPGVRERSDLEREITPIDLNATYTRVLKQDGQPATKVIAFEFERVFRKGLSSFPSYRYRHELIVRDSSFNVIDKVQASILDRQSNTVVYEIAHNPKHAHYTTAIETYVDNSEGMVESNEKLVSVGRAFYNVLPPLDSDPNKLELSDLVLGINLAKPEYVAKLPFPIIPSQRLWRSDTLQVYAEIYHLAMAESGTGRFAIDFRVARLGKKEDDFERLETISTGFEFDASNRTSKETFGIDISNLRKGDYELRVDVTDLISSQSKSRSKRFQILEQDE